MFTTESDIDWKSPAKRLKEFIEPYYEGRDELLRQISQVQENAKPYDKIIKLDDGKFIRISKTSGSFLRLLVTTDNVTYPGEYYAAPKSLKEGYKINLEEGKIVDILEVDLDKTREMAFSQYKYIEHHYEDGLDPFEATLVWLPKLKVFF